MKTKLMMKDKMNPVIEQASQPMTLVLYDILPHNVYSFPNENILFSLF